jgi:hypothetical protein
LVGFHGLICGAVSQGLRLEATTSMPKYNYNFTVSLRLSNAAGKELGLATATKSVACLAARVSFTGTHRPPCFHYRPITEFFYENGELEDTAVHSWTQVSWVKSGNVVGRVKKKKKK